MRENELSEIKTSVIFGIFRRGLMFFFPIVILARENKGLFFLFGYIIFANLLFFGTTLHARQLGTLSWTGIGGGDRGI